MASISIDPGGKTGIYFSDGEQEQLLEINKPTKDGLNLFRLLGAIECLEVQQVKSVNVLKVKEMTKRLLNGLTKIAELEFKKGR
ncbi:26290_t:CDS:2, partial [Racocetra persica]